MKRIQRIAVALLLGTTTGVWAADGLVRVQSPHGPRQTMDRFETIVEEQGLNVFARIDHAEGAESVDMDLRPTEVLIFGNPRGGTPFMQCAQSVGIDLPLKALVWEDEDGQTWLGYNDPAWIAQRHDAADCPPVENISEALEKLSAAAVAE
ncbi:DUF302 domain-containing protein [Spiribacter halobius]|uniref:DUF302 domain-containing protein n=1 Tax=Sediminicurvatus halobius TaxID=2182432 RepID=A0A2U2N3U3_9GAMM|nr:DUF302 domain-containing protein [Spiribacter halobius]PWG63881.1 hypothetical protein DEM34_06680 [Spiribacter halobius]UEX76288.1 DUF302 domain-containing protein [Spiribacter halobius]